MSEQEFAEPRLRFPDPRAPSGAGPPLVVVVVPYWPLTAGEPFWARRIDKTTPIAASIRSLERALPGVPLALSIRSRDVPRLRAAITLGRRWTTVRTERLGFAERVTELLERMTRRPAAVIVGPDAFWCTADDLRALWSAFVRRGRSKGPACLSGLPHGAFAIAATARQMSAVQATAAAHGLPDTLACFTREGPPLVGGLPAVMRVPRLLAGGRTRVTLPLASSHLMPDLPLRRLQTGTLSTIQFREALHGAVLRRHAPALGPLRPRRPRSTRRASPSVLIICNSLGYSGVHVTVERLCRALAARGRKVTLLLQPDAPLARRPVPGCHRVACRPTGHLATELREARDILRSVKPDLIHHEGLTGQGILLAAQELRIPVLTRVSSANAESYLDAMLLARHLVTPSAFVRQRVVSFGMPEEAITIVEDGVPIPRRGSAIRRASGTPRLLVMGRIDTQKRQLLAVQALDFVDRPVELTLAGDWIDPIYLQRVADAARRSRHAVRLVGHRDEAAALAARAHLLLNVAEDEGLGLSLLEAMAAGTPVLSVSSGGAPEVFPSSYRSGLCGATPEEIGTAISRLLAEDLRSLGRVLRAHAAARYSVQAMCDRWCDLYDRAGDDAR